MRLENMQLATWPNSRGSRAPALARSLPTDVSAQLGGLKELISMQMHALMRQSQAAEAPLSDAPQPEMPQTAAGTSQDGPALTDGTTKLSQVDPDTVPLPAAGDRRAIGDDRSATEIIDQNPVLKNLGNQGEVPKLDQNGDPVFKRDKDGNVIKDKKGNPEVETIGVREGLKQRVGDFEHDPDAARRAVDVLNYIKTSRQADGKTQRSASVVDNGKIEGFTKGGDARHGTEAGMLQDFCKKGHGYLSETKHNLPVTSDGHVRADGTNMSNVQFAGHKILEGLSKAFQWMAKIADKVLGKIPGIGKLLAGAANLVTTAISGALHVADTAVQHGDTKKAAKEMGADMVGALVNTVDPTGLGGDAASNAIRQKIA